MLTHTSLNLKQFSSKVFHIRKSSLVFKPKSIKIELKVLDNLEDFENEKEFEQINVAQLYSIVSKSK